MNVINYISSIKDRALLINPACLTVWSAINAHSSLTIGLTIRI